LPPPSQPTNWRTTPCWLSFCLFGIFTGIHVWRPSPPSASCMQRGWHGRSQVVLDNSEFKFRDCVELIPQPRSPTKCLWIEKSIKEGQGRIRTVEASLKKIRDTYMTGCVPYSVLRNTWLIFWKQIPLQWRWNFVAWSAGRCFFICAFFVRSASWEGGVRPFSCFISDSTEWIPVEFGIRGSAPNVAEFHFYPYLFIENPDLHETQAPPIFSKMIRLIKNVYMA
jgi:hypothetical protein